MPLKFVRYGNLKEFSGAGIGTSLYEVHTALDGQTVFNLAGKYRPGLNELQIYLNGVRQIVGVDYQETSDSIVTFLASLDAGDSVLFQVEELRQRSLHQEFVAVAGQKVFTLASSYRMGENTLQVFEDGILLRLNSDYIEVDEYTVEFLYELEADSKITFHEIV